MVQVFNPPPHGIKVSKETGLDRKKCKVILVTGRGSP
jgi:hypothetical protein